MWRIYLRKTDSEFYIEIGVFKDERDVEELFSLYEKNYGTKEKDFSGTVKRLFCLSYCELIALKDNKKIKHRGVVHSVKREENVKIEVAEGVEDEKAACFTD